MALASDGNAPSDKPTLDLGFVGTIADWIDFDALLAALDHHPRLRVHLWGPAVVRIPAHDRLVWHGVGHGPSLILQLRAWTALSYRFICRS